MKKIIITLSLLLGLSISFVFGQVDSQWRGPNRDGIYPNESLLKKWPNTGPKLLWSVEGLGDGYSSAAVTSDRVFVTGEADGKGTLFAFDLIGKSIWKSPY